MFTKLNLLVRGKSTNTNKKVSKQRTYENCGRKEERRARIEI